MDTLKKYADCILVYVAYFLNHVSRKKRSKGV